MELSAVMAVKEMKKIANKMRHTFIEAEASRPTVDYPLGARDSCDILRQLAQYVIVVAGWLAGVDISGNEEKRNSIRN